MQNLKTYEEFLISMTDENILCYLFDNNLILEEMICKGTCGTPMKLERDTSYVDNHAWRCYSQHCNRYHKKRSIRDMSFFEPFGIEAKTILRIISKHVSNLPRHSILCSICVSAPTLSKILKNLIKLMNKKNLLARKLGGFGTQVRIDETMLNFKCKSHRGRSTENKTDAITMVEVRNGITINVHDEIIPNKTSEVMIPMILKHIVAGSTIYIDEHRTYFQLKKYEIYHQTICHKFNFIEAITLVHTQNIESFNNYLKYEIKNRKGIKT